MLLIAAAASFGMSSALTYILCTAGRHFLSVDVPNARSLHVQPTPRGAGLAILATLAATGGAFLLVEDAPRVLPWIVVGATAVAAISWLDDRRSVPPMWRLAVHVIAAAVFVAPAALAVTQMESLGTMSPAGVLYGASLVVAIAWFTNLYNFMDGMDGFAGGMTAIGFGALGVLAWLADDVPLAIIFTLLSGAAAGFLVFNLPPARIFLGDVGASTLGYLAATLGLLAIWRGTVSWPAFVLVFSPFVVDASVTLVRRLVSGARVWHAHRTHFYQRLVAAGWTTSRTLSAEYALMIACAVTAVVVEWLRLDWSVVIGVWLLVYTGLMAAVGRVERSRQHDPPGDIRTSAV